MIDKNELLLNMYMLGFNDELEQKENFKKLEKAYNLGKNHALLGDEISSIDDLTNKEILKILKKL